MNEIVNTVKLFFESFDNSDWSQMRKCLDDQIEVDYESFRGTPKYVSTAIEYIELRKKSMKDLKTIHKTNKHVISEENKQFICLCDFRIERFTNEGDDYFHSYGQYEIGLKIINKQIKIFSIKQWVNRNVGNSSIHRGYKA